MCSKREIIFAWFLVQTCVMASPNSCGTEDKGGIHLEDYHGGHSYSSYDFDPVFMVQDTLRYQVSFCTEGISGMIVRIVSFEQEEEVVIEVKNRQVVIHLIKSDVPDPECEFRLSKTVTDGVNYLIKLELRKDEIRIYLLDKYGELYSTRVHNISTCIENRYDTFLHLEKGGMIDQFYSQGMNNTDVAKQNYRGKPFLYGNFEGCMGDSMINGIPLSKAGNRTQNHDIDESCHHTFGSECTDICGTTRIRNKANRCACPDDSEVNEYGLCSPSCNCVACENGGRCTLDIGNPKCHCTPGYEGPRCERKIDPCLNFQCHNGGSCIPQSDSQPSCVCPPDFTGSRCENENVIPLDPCKQNSCENNATCRSNSTLDEGYFCECTLEYDGKFCDRKKQQDKADESKVNSTVIFVGSLSGVVFLMIIMAVLYVRYRRSIASKLGTDEKRRNESGTPAAPSQPEVNSNPS